MNFYLLVLPVLGVLIVLMMYIDTTLPEVSDRETKKKRTGKIRVVISHKITGILPFLDHATKAEIGYHHDGVMAPPSVSIAPGRLPRMNERMRAQSKLAS